MPQNSQYTSNATRAARRIAGIDEHEVTLQAPMSAFRKAGRKL
jgi:hypothetical protein